MQANRMTRDGNGFALGSSTAWAPDSALEFGPRRNESMMPGVSSTVLAGAEAAGSMPSSAGYVSDQKYCHRVATCSLPFNHVASWLSVGDSGQEWDLDRCFT